MGQPAVIGGSPRRWWQRRVRCGPARSVLRLPWRQVEYCVVDLETTGLDLDHDSVVSYGAVVVSDGRIQGATSTYATVRPDCRVSAGAVCVHNLRDVDLVDAPSSAEAFANLVTLLQDRILVAHAAWIEHSFLTRTLHGLGVRLVGPVVDTAELARVAGLARAAAGREPSLEGLATTLGLEPHAPHHALGDALTTAEVFLVLATRLGAGTAKTAGSLAHDLILDLPSPVRSQMPVLRRAPTDRRPRR